MKVAHITTVDMSLRYLLLNQLQSIQVDEFEVIGISTPGPNVNTIEAANIKHIPVNITRRISPFSDLKSLYTLWRVIRRERFTIVHTHNPKPGLLGQIAARFAGVPIVVNTLHGFYFHDNMSPNKRRFYIWMERIAARFSDIILSQNSEDIQTAIREKICQPEKIKFLGNGIDIKRFNVNQINNDELIRKRKELGLSEGIPVIGFVGRLVKEKGILELLEAISLVRKQIKRVQLLIIGPVDSEKQDALTPEIANRYGLKDITIFAGIRDDMPEMYALMDVFVLPSHREGFPRSPMEASAMGVPCIVTDIRGCREAVKHKVNGLLVPLGDVQALGNAIINMIEDKVLSQKLGNGGRQLAIEQFDEQIVFSKVKREYTRLLKEKGIQ